MDGPERAVTVWVATVALAGSIALVFAAVAARGADGDVGVAVALAAADLVLVMQPIRYRYRGEIHGLTAEQAVSVAMLLVLPASWVPLSIAAASAVGHSLRGSEARKVVFNVGSAALTAGAGSVVFLAFDGSSTGITPARIGVAAVALLAMEVVAQVAIAELFRRFGHGRVSDVLRGLLPVLRFTLPGSLAAGLVLGALAATGVAGATAGAFGVLVLFLAYRAIVGVDQQRKRLENLRAVSRALVGASRSIDAFDEALAATARLFQADRAELLMNDDGLHRVVNHDGAIILDQKPSEAAVDLAADGAVADGDVLAAPLERGGHRIGVLVLHDAGGLEPWDEADAGVLAGLADEVVVALENAELVEALAAERAELVSQSALLSGILDGASDGIALVDETGIVQSWNPAMGAIVGVPVSVALDRRLDELLHVVDEDGALVDLDLPQPRTLVSGVASARTWRIRRPGGDVRFVRALMTAAHARGSDGIVVVARDITATREVERLKADFVTTVSHELRTPLTPIGGNLDLLLRRGDQIDDGQRREMLESMKRQVERLGKLVEDLTVVAEIDRDMVDLSYEQVDLDEIAREVVKHGQSRIDLDLAGDVQAVGDRDAIHNVAQSLITNALRHTTGRVRVSTSWTRTRAILSVEDSGEGIPPADQEAIFEQFRRLGAIEHHTRGAGLGLPIARALARRLGGDVTVASTVGIGSVFTLVLPTGPTRRPGAVAAQRPDSVDGTHTTVPANPPSAPPTEFAGVRDVGDDR